MLTRRVFFNFASAAILFASPALAGGSAPFTQSAFEAAQNEGKPILIEIAASWCPTCRAQEPIIKDILGSDKFKEMVAFRVDFDDQKDVVRTFGAQSQSTLIVFAGTKEVGRSVGETDPSSIEALLGQAL
jgi:thioredoxin-like negative regulator of GroEL